MRKVKIAFPGSQKPSEITSAATTWGVLKDELKSQLDVSFKNTKVRDYTTNHHYSSDDAILPKGDLKLIVSTDKNKSGMPINKRNYKKAGFRELRTFCKKMTGSAPNGKDACLAALDAYYGETTTSVAPKKAAKKTATAKKAEVKVAAKPKSTSSSLEARVAKLEGVIFGEDEEDAKYLAAVRANN